MASQGSDVVKVAVRVRPFNEREIQEKAKCCVEMVGDETRIYSPEGKLYKFTYNYCYWSQNKNDEHYASQEVVYSDLGKSVLDNAWEGYNTSLFAYGQTGAGKSYSMVGPKDDSGIIPRVCKELFERMKQDPKTRFRVETSMIEIYNESVRDLFNPTNPLNHGGGLRVREHPKTGPYVEGLELCVVHNYEEVSSLMEEGAKMRTIAKTNMNDTSSRAHTIFQIIFTQSRATITDDGQTVVSEKVSKINLIDLAGSERVSKSGATGQRLKEGNSINVSLTALGNVINKLAEKCSGEKQKVFVPYRDSQLTWLLKESLGGNAKTIMIAAISPTQENFAETLSTLRYAARAKVITNKARINEDPNVKIIRELKEEIERLKMLLSERIPATPQTNMKQVESEDNLKLLEQLEASQKIIQQLQMTSEDKEKRTIEIQRARQKALADAGLSITEQGEVIGIDANNTPHFINLNEDPMMTGCLVYFFKEGETKIGRDKSNTITLTGLHIKAEHCVVTNDAGKVMIFPISDAIVYINGKQIEGPIELHSQDRVILGSNHVFRFSNPLKPGEASFMTIDWNYAQNELAEEQNRLIKLAIMKKEQQLEESMKERLRALEEEFEMEKQKHQESINKQIQELESKKKEVDAELQKNRIRPRSKSSSWRDVFVKVFKNMQDKFKSTKQEVVQEQEKEIMQQRRLDEQLIRMLPLIKDANDIATEMKKNVKYDMKIVVKNNLPLLSIQVLDRNKNPPKISLWQPEEFENRLYKIRERYRLWQQDQDNYIEVHETRDPFYDSYINLIGACKVSLKSLALNMPQEHAAEILDNDGELQGYLLVAFEPCTPDMKSRPSPVKNSDELLGTSIHFIIKIVGLSNMVKPISSNTFVRFRFYTENYVSTNYASGKNPSFNFKRKYHIKNVTEDLINYLEDSEIVFEVFGEQKSEEPWLNLLPSPEAKSPIGSKRRTSALAPLSPDTEDLRSQNQKLFDENEELKRRLNDANIRHFRSLVKNVSKENVLRGDIKQLPLSCFNGLRVHVFEAEKLPAVDVLGKADRFVKIQFGEQKKKTSVKHSTSQPCWDEDVSFRFFEKPKPSDILTIKVLDFDKYFKNDVIGKCEVTLSQLLDIFKGENEKGVFFELEGKKLQQQTRIRLAFKFEL